MDEIKAAAAGAFRIRQGHAPRPGETAGMIGDSEFEVLAVTTRLHNYRLAPGAGGSVLNRIIARLHQRQFTVQHFTLAPVVLGEQLTHRLRNPAYATEIALQLEPQPGLRWTAREFRHGAQWFRS
jgi:hypothetical protein